MEVIGGSSYRFFDGADEGTHEPGAHRCWQESVVLVWYDMKSGIGGMHRIGHEVHNKSKHENGQIQDLFILYFREGGIYKQIPVHPPLTEQDRFANGMSSGDRHVYTYNDGTHSWKYEDGEAAVDLVMIDFHQGIELWSQAAGTIADDFAKNHIEAGGLIKGTVEIKGKTHQVEGYAYRDHSWGVREWNSFKTERWVVGCLGPDRSFAAFSWGGNDNTMKKAGYLYEYGKVIYCEDIDILAYLEIDGCTHRGGRVVLYLADGREITLECSPMGIGSISYYRYDRVIACLDTPCEVRSSDSEEVGYCNFEMVNNAQNGTQEVTNLVRAIDRDGFTSDENYPQYVRQ